MIGACLDTGNDLVVYSDTVEAARARTGRQEQDIRNDLNYLRALLGR